MKKNEVYVKMLSLSITHIRNVQSLSKKEKENDLSCFFEAELVHNMMYTLLISDFVEHDVWFLNTQAKYYFENCNEVISPNYNKQIEYIKYLFEIIPIELSVKLSWRGPL